MKEKFVFPRVSIVIATLNNAKTLRKVLLGMLKLDYPSEFEVIVVADGCTDETSQMLKKEFGKTRKIKFIELNRSGVCKARNTGIEKARFPIVINMDHDCIPDKNWLKEMAKGFAEKKVGVVSAYGHFGGTSTGFRKELLDRVGGYDRDYFYYREDTDLAFKIIELGYEFKRVKANYVHDHEMAKPKGIIEFSKHVLQRIAYHQNDALLYKKHPNKLCEDFLNIKLGFIVNPVSDFKTATGLWQKKGKFELSSPRGITFLKNKSIAHSFLIVLGGILYVIAVKISRLIGSIKHKKLLL